MDNSGTISTPELRLALKEAGESQILTEIFLVAYFNIHCLCSLSSSRFQSE